MVSSRKKNFLLVLLCSSAALNVVDSFLVSSLTLKPAVQTTKSIEYRSGQRKKLPSYHSTKQVKLHNMSCLKSQKLGSDSKTSLNDKMLYKVGSTTSTVVAGTFFVALAYQRDTFMLTFFIGSILNGITSKILKKALNQDRPAGYENDSSIEIKPSDKGMPSSHAMSLGFIGIYTAITLCCGLLSTVGTGAQIVTCIGLLAYIAVSLVYRVKSQLHTTDQVVVGLFFGTLNGLTWYTLASGNNVFFPKVHIMDFVSSTMLPDSGIMPIQFLAIPALVGAAVVGSFERRISGWIRKKNN